ncbi:DUF2169 family type VI secretion system accessory protein [Polyangium aurulentum]|uniref:DUF2169 family type VI secretion system accessory protein n=1 Tax=Polyangium aurulentum TaxID=2567896 RepID=UPI0010AE8AF5|nr:DUF2169 domain-containing protein [Polyangium aurulentum]UQA62816.1 DUF2169 domain-containing protein [Polyangium aurulentum]
MDILSLSPLQSSYLLFRQTSGEWAQAVVCKATYVLSPGLAKLAAEQEPPNEDDNHWNDDTSRSLYAPSDLVPFKPHADVLLVGSAFAPGNVPVQSLTVRLAAARIDKSIEVLGDRASRDGIAQEAARFTTMPLRYERAAGGPETWNPVGMNLYARPDAQGLVRLPNLQPSALAGRDPRMLNAPVGFGPIAPSWPGRATKLGRNAGYFSDITWRQRPLPDGVDLSFFNAAPHDQQAAELRDDERIVLENLHREHPQLVTMLPGLHPRAFVVESAGALRQEIKMKCDTLWIDTDRSICTLTWRGILPLARADEPGRVAIVMEERSQRLSRADVERLLGIPSREAPSTRGAASSFMDDEPQIDGTFQLSSTQQSHAAKSAAAPAWLAQPKPDRNAPPPPQSQPQPPPPPPPLQAITKPMPPPTAESPWAVGARPVSTPPPLLGDIASAKNAAPPRPVDADAAPKARASSPQVVELLWLDPKFTAKIRKNPQWKKHLPESKPRRASESESDSETSAERKEAKERREVTLILKGGEAAALADLEDAIEAAMADGTFAPPLVLTGGEIELPFDEQEVLKATAAVAGPFAASDKSLKEAVDKANEATPVDKLMCDKLVTRIRDAFALSQRSMPQNYLPSQADRILLEGRHYQKRTLLGQRWIRSLLTVPGATSPIPAYLPESLAEELPMFQRFSAKVVAEARPALDQYEAHPSALRVVALGRLIPPLKRSAR